MSDETNLADIFSALTPNFYSPLIRTCRERNAEEVVDKERANFCGYFKALLGAYHPGKEARSQIMRVKRGELISAGDKADQRPEP